MVNGRWQASRVVTVLVVNDEPAIRSMLREVLEDEGFVAETAEDGQQGLAMLRRSLVPRVLVLDDTMPVMGGPEVLDALTADPALAKRTTCVYLTSRPESFSPVLMRILMDFNAPVLTYPLDMEVFLRAVEEAAAHLPPR